MPKAILVIGGTGKQGGSVLRALVAHPAFSSSEYTIYVVTRNPESTSARDLAAKSSAIKLVRGDLSNARAIFRALPSAPRAVYAVTVVGKNEVAEGNALVDEAIKAGVSHLVFSSVDRGNANGGNTPSKVPHWITKHEIERHLRLSAQRSEGKFTYTILRPVFFLDNLEAGFNGKVSANLWKDYLGSKPLKVIDTTDIGLVAVAALLEADSPAYRNAEINLVGDELTFAEANEIFKATIGKPIPTTYKFLTSLILLLAKDLKLMTQFLQEPGFGAEVGGAEPSLKMTDFGAWVRKSSFVKRAD
jgi:uncharacterized protein YbjT (DUF2867 family)